MDMFDDDLKGIMGKCYDDGQTPVKAVAPEQKARPKAEEKKPEFMGAKFVSIPKYAPNYMTRLKGCAKWALIFGGLTFLFFYWQEAGLMDPMAAVPSMCACTGLGGLKIGMICREES